MTARKLFYLSAYLTGIGFFALLSMATYQHFQKTHSILSFGVVAVNGLILMLYLLRREPVTVIGFPTAWLIGVAGTCLPLLLRPRAADFVPAFAEAGYSLQIFGLMAIVGSLLSLRTSIGIVAANRGIREGGLYRIVRHPLYASELLFFLRLRFGQSKHRQSHYPFCGFRGPVFQGPHRGEFSEG